ncbi:iron-sulfur cluster assembly scaffold protein [Pelagibacteraceae bacterium]|jgi:nitrogen fixation NifU-like protein|nr:iron-sulfur cluster assembly scaffold protein [Pelagibacteraceae bacterium]
MISQKIIHIASNTKYSGLNNNFTHKSSIKNSLCGDKIKIELIANNKKISSMRYETESCILCEASASLIAKNIKNYSLSNLKKDIIILKDIIKNNKSIYPSKFKEYKHLTTKNNINRTSCVILPLEALLKAFKL